MYNPMNNNNNNRDIDAANTKFKLLEEAARKASQLLPTGISEQSFPSCVVTQLHKTQT